MKPTGRPPKPKNLKVLHGDREDRINRAEPMPSSSGDVVPPCELSVAAQEVWDRLAPDLIRTGVLTCWDVDAFAAYCEVVVLVREGFRTAREKPVKGATAPTRLLKDSLGAMTALGGRFGLTPADRTKITVGEAKRDDKERLLA